MSITERTALLHHVNMSADGAGFTASASFDGGMVVYRRTVSQEECGPWLHAVQTVAADFLCRLREVDGVIVAIGHATEDRWFDPRPEHQRAAETKRTSEREQALRHINLHRARAAERDLDDGDWTDDDVLIHARDLGWNG